MYTGSNYKKVDAIKQSVLNCDYLKDKNRGYLHNFVRVPGFLRHTFCSFVYKIILLHMYQAVITTSTTVTFNDKIGFLVIN